MRSVLVAICLLLAAATGGAASAAEAIRLGPITIEAERDPAGWESGGERDEVRLANRGDPGAIRYYFAQVPQPVGRRSLGLTVTVSPDSQAGAGAGLLFGFDPQARTYLAYFVSREGNLVLLRRDAEGFQRILSVSGAAIGAPVQLALRETESKVEFFANGRRVFTWSGSGAAGPAGGIIAIGRGGFAFRDLAFDAAGR